VTRTVKPRSALIETFPSSLEGSPPWQSAQLTPYL
jgi:hypothetical protein